MKFNPLIAILFCLLFCCSTLINAQTLNLNDVRKASLSGSGTITQDDAIKGYYTLYEVDKADKKDRVYKLKITDANLDGLQETTLTRPKGTVMLGAKYNGEALCLSLINTRERSIELLTYSKEGKELGSRIFEVDSKAYATLLQLNSFSEEDGGVSLVKPVPNKGFVFYLPTSDKGVRYTMYYVPNDLKGGWENVADEGRGKFQFALNLAATEDYILTSVTSRPKSTAVKNTLNTIEIHKVSDGSLVGQMIPAQRSPRMAVNNAFYEPETNTFMLGGMYFSSTADVNKDESTGLAIQRISLDGKRLENARVSWTKAFISIGRKKTEHLKKGGSVYVHRLINRPGDGFMAVGEYYDDEVSALGIASMVLGGGDSDISVKKIVLQDLFTFGFNDELEFEEAKIYSKPKQSVELPAGSLYLSPARLAQLLDLYNWYDYRYMQVFPDRGQTVLAYTTIESEKGKLLRQPKFNLITEYADEEEPIIKVLDRKSDATSISYSEGKPGYVMVREYFRKAKKLTFRLEPVD